jgi:hypothetical protein
MIPHPTNSFKSANCPVVPLVFAFYRRAPYLTAAAVPEHAITWPRSGANLVSSVSHQPIMGGADNEEVDQRAALCSAKDRAQD